jgi:peptide/nickel transport system ATP-binding protein
MRREIRQQGASLILITHDLAVVAEMVDKITVLYCGRVVETGPVRQVLEAPSHPYTRGLIDSIPNPEHRLPRLRQIPGTVPDIRRLPPGCAFRARCPRAGAICAEVEPVLTAQPGGNSAACHFPLAPGELA